MCFQVVWNKDFFAVLQAKLVWLFLWKCLGNLLFNRGVRNVQSTFGLCTSCDIENKSKVTVRSQPVPHPNRAQTLSGVTLQSFDSLFYHKVDKTIVLEMVIILNQIFYALAN